MAEALPPAFNYESFDLPENVSMTFHLGHHYSSLDLPDTSVLDRTLREVDIVIPEFMHSPSSKNIMGAIAMGRPKEYQRFRAAVKDNEMGAWLSTFASSLYGSRTTTANVDIHVDHPAAKAFFRADPGIRRAEAWVVRERYDDILPLLNNFFSAIKERDQAILQNIKPEIEAAVASNRSLVQKREDEPLDVHLFYGSVHTSLFDAARFRQKSEPTGGFDVKRSEDSIENELMESMYANFLRGEDISVDDVEKYFGYLLFVAHIERFYLKNKEFSSQELQSCFIEIAEQLDYSDPKTIPAQVDELLRSEVLDSSKFID